MTKNFLPSNQMIYWQLTNFIVIRKHVKKLTFYLLRCKLIRKNYLSELSSMQKLAFHLSTIGTSILRLLPAETAHNLGVDILRKGLIPRSFMPPIGDLCEGLDINVPGLGSLQHPIGLAAGFDKHALAPAGFSALGLSYIEIAPSLQNHRRKMQT